MWTAKVALIARAVSVLSIRRARAILLSRRTDPRAVMHATLCGVCRSGGLPQSHTQASPQRQASSCTSMLPTYRRWPRARLRVTQLVVHAGGRWRRRSGREGRGRRSGTRPGRKRRRDGTGAGCGPGAATGGGRAAATAVPGSTTRRSGGSPPPDSVGSSPPPPPPSRSPDLAPSAVLQHITHTLRHFLLPPPHDILLLSLYPPPQLFQSTDFDSPAPPSLNNHPTSVQTQTCKRVAGVFLYGISFFLVFRSTAVFLYGISFFLVFRSTAVFLYGISFFLVFRSTAVFLYGISFFLVFRSTAVFLYGISFFLVFRSTAVFLCGISFFLVFRSTAVFLYGISFFLVFRSTRYARSPPTKANRVQSPAGSPDFRKWESRWTIPLVGGFSRGSPAPYSLQSPSSALKTSLLRAAQISSLTHYSNNNTNYAGLAQVVPRDAGVEPAVEDARRGDVEVRDDVSGGAHEAARHVAGGGWQRPAVQQPRHLRGRVAGGGAAQRHRSPRLQSLLREPRHQLRGHCCKHVPPKYSTLQHRHNACLHSRNVEIAEERGPEVSEGSTPQCCVKYFAEVGTSSSSRPHTRLASTRSMVVMARGALPSRGGRPTHRVKNRNCEYRRQQSAYIPPDARLPQSPRMHSKSESAISISEITFTGSRLISHAGCLAKTIACAASQACMLLDMSNQDPSHSIQIKYKGKRRSPRRLPTDGHENPCTYISSHYKAFGTYEYGKLVVIRDD
ncbi:hypothetical protein PR048_024403 [Dryococelus australis]|uniref:Uncharacterized protein n=1 Tax=Dryococelus australis TaxID=614101 RepID=A0ABQ9GNG8_9NEOP|nr:hypothetical protein PR048_024403 [Dryococelus australis]